MSLHDYLQMLKDNGLDTLPGTAAEVLDDDVRHLLSRKKVTVKQWVNVVTTAHKLGIPSTSTMMYGHAERDDEIVEHLRALRDLQDETHGFTAFIPWSFKPGNTLLEKKIPESPGPVKYLRIIATARAYLDNWRRHREEAVPYERPR